MNGRMVGARWPSCQPVEHSARPKLASPDPFGEDLRSGRIDKPEGSRGTVNTKKNIAFKIFIPLGEGIYRKHTDTAVHTHTIVGENRSRRRHCDVKSIGRQAVVLL